MNADQRKSVRQFLMDDVRKYSDGRLQLIRSEDSSTGFLNVFVGARGTFRANVSIFGFNFSLGTYHTAEKAARIYAIAKHIISAPDWRQSAEHLFAFVILLHPKVAKLLMTAIAEFGRLKLCYRYRHE